MVENGQDGIYEFLSTDNLPSNVSNLCLFHYTSPEGLHGILSSKSLRFSDCQFLNDKSEYIYIKKPLDDAYEQVKEYIHSNVIKEIIDTFSYEFDEKYLLYNGNEPSPSERTKRYYILCASLDSDSLNMWNYYTKTGNYKGYNLEIDMDALLNCFNNSLGIEIDIFYGNVIYSSEKQIDMLKRLLHRADEMLHQDLKKISELEGEEYDEQYIDAQYSAANYLLSYLEMYRLFFKSQAFIHENEFRFVIHAPTMYNKDPKLKPGFVVKNGIIAPYFQLSFEGKQIVRSITLSPMLDRDLAETGLKQFINHCGYKTPITINQSSIPVRF